MAKMAWGATKAKRNRGEKEGAPGTVLDEGDTVSVVSGIAWLTAAGLDTKAVEKAWKSCPNKGVYAREAFINRVIDENGLRVKLMAHARKVLEKAIA